MYRLDKIIRGDAVYAYTGTGLLVITNKINGRQYVLSSTKMQTCIDCLKYNSDTSKHFTADRDKYAHLDFEEVWDLYIIALDKDIPTCKLRRLRHQMCCKLNTWYPRGYDHKTDYRMSNDARTRTRRGTKLTYKQKRLDKSHKENQDANAKKCP